MRTEAKLTQAELGAQLSVSAGTVGHYEHGRSPIHLDTLFLLALSCGWLLEMRFTKPNHDEEVEP
jgi:transcriptional regulator with XRE-family HTH domain